MKPRERLQHVSKRLSEPSHLLYLGFVGYEAHGYYGMAAIVCLVVSVVHYVSAPHHKKVGDP